MSIHCKLCRRNRLRGLCGIPGRPEIRNLGLIPSPGSNEIKVVRALVIVARGEGYEHNHIDKGNELEHKVSSINCSSQPHDNTYAASRYPQPCLSVVVAQETGAIERFVPGSVRRLSTRQIK